jgi:hypothetical protein
LHSSATLSDLDLIRQSSAERSLHPQLLSDAELMRNGQITMAALILLGTRKALGELVKTDECRSSRAIAGVWGNKRTSFLSMISMRQEFNLIGAYGA